MKNEKSGMKNVTYVEPFAGGAGVSLELLFSGEVDHIVINDYDKAIYSIWRAIIENTNQFVELIENTEVSVDEWYRQKNIYTNQSNQYSVELAFATFFLNRTNRSGILAAGPIGGYEQNGNYLIDTNLPENEWLYGYLLSFGDKLRIMSPSHIKNIVIDKMKKSIENYM